MEESANNRKNNEASGSVQKLQEVPGSSRKPQEASGRHTNNIKIKNKNKKINILKAQIESKISTVKKHCLPITLLMKGC